MNLMKCDICGKTMTWDEWGKEDNASVTVKIHRDDGNLDYHDDIDFCEECSVKFLVWMKGAKNESVSR